MATLLIDDQRVLAVDRIARTFQEGNHSAFDEDFSMIAAVDNLSEGKGGSCSRAHVLTSSPNSRLCEEKANIKLGETLYASLGDCEG